MIDEGSNLNLQSQKIYFEQSKRTKRKLENTRKLLYLL